MLRWLGACRDHADVREQHRLPSRSYRGLGRDRGARHSPPGFTCGQLEVFSREVHLHGIHIHDVVRAVRRVGRVLALMAAAIIVIVVPVDAGVDVDRATILDVVLPRELDVSPGKGAPPTIIGNAY
jgi:hypothetical protein